MSLYNRNFYVPLIGLSRLERLDVVAVLSVMDGMPSFVSGLEIGDYLIIFWGGAYTTTFTPTGYKADPSVLPQIVTLMAVDPTIDLVAFGLLTE